MRTEIRKPFSHGFVLTEQELRRIYDTMLQQIERITKQDTVVTTFELKFKNEVVAEKASLDEIISENNSGKWEIQELRVTLSRKSQVQENQIRIEFRVPPAPKLYSIYYYVLGDERDWVYLTSS